MNKNQVEYMNKLLEGIHKCADNLYSVSENMYTLNKLFYIYLTEVATQKSEGFSFSDILEKILKK